MKKMAVGAVLILVSGQVMADRMRDALWSNFQRDPSKIDICARKIASGIEFDRSTDWPAYCNYFADTDLVQNRAAEIKKQIAKSNSTTKEKELIKTGRIWIGATAKQAELSWGKPSKVNRTITAYGTEEQWVYGSSYLYLTDGRVTAIQN